MEPLPLPLGWSRFSLGALEATPWRNGAGVTREIASGQWQPPDPAAGAQQTTPWDWRVSVADIAQEGPFSIFANTDRQAALASGQALQLRSGAAVLRFDALGDVHRFPGEEALSAQLPGGPVQLFNLMTRRGRATATLAAVHADTRLELGGDCALVLLTVRGAFGVAVHGPGDRVGPEHPLHCGDGMALTPGTRATIQLVQSTPAACLLMASIRPA
jgi:environmental stress-induced protein Ves